MGFIGLNEALFIGAILLALILGPKKLPELARSIGESKKQFKQSMNEADEVLDEAKPNADEQSEDVNSEESQ